MGKTKEYDVRSINFGKRGEPARIIVEQFVEKNGNASLSPLIRNLIVSFFADKPEYNKLKAKVLIEERKQVGGEICDLAVRKRKIDDDLRSLGVDPDEIFH